MHGLLCSGITPLHERSLWCFLVKCLSIPRCPFLYIVGHQLLCTVSSEGTLWKCTLTDPPPAAPAAACSSIMLLLQADRLNPRQPQRSRRGSLSQPLPPHFGHHSHTHLCPGPRVRLLPAARGSAWSPVWSLCGVPARAGPRSLCTRWEDQPPMAASPPAAVGAGAAAAAGAAAQR